MTRALLLLALCATLSFPAIVLAKPGDKAMLDVQTLSAANMQGRAPNTPGSALARSYIINRLTALGVQPVGGAYEHPFVSGGVRGTNVLAIIPGRLGGDRVMVVSAHYDHLGVQDGKIYNGADDNASGVAGVLAVAEAFSAKPPKNTVILAIFDAEEKGLVGAKYFVNNPPVPLSRVVINLNLDMISKNSKNQLYAAGAFHFPYMRGRIDAIAADQELQLLQGHDRGNPIQDWTSQSDHYAFHQKGVPWIYLGVVNHSEYHSPRDDWQTIPAQFFERAIDCVIDTARYFDGDLRGIAADAGR